MNNMPSSSPKGANKKKLKKKGGRGKKKKARGLSPFMRSEGGLWHKKGKGAGRSSSEGGLGSSKE